MIAIGYCLAVVQMPNGFVGDRVPCPNSVLYSSYSNSCIEEELIEVRTAEQMFSDPSCTGGSPGPDARDTGAFPYNP